MLALHAFSPGAPCSPPEATPSPLTELVPKVYARLRQLARMHLRGEREGHTLDSGALVHEAYLRLRTAAPEAAEGDSAAFLRMAARVMRETLVDHARRRHAKKRGGRDAAAAPPEDSKEAMTDGDAERLLLLEDALVRLQEQDAQAARLVEYRAFGGMTLEEAADALQLSHRTARRRWSFAKAWLQRELSP